MMSEKKKRNIIIGILCTILLLMVVGYAAFNSLLNIKGTSNINSNWDIKITEITSNVLHGTPTNAKAPEGIGTLEASFETNLVLPGDSIEYTITISNSGNINAKLDKITLSEPDNEYVTFETSGLTEGESLNVGSTADLKVVVTFKDVEINKMDKSTSKLTVTLDYSQLDNSSETPGPNESYAADDLRKTVVTTGDGLYEDTTETGRYIYKGSTPNNYITFNNEMWRIMSVESDGTLKVIRDNSIGSDILWDIKGTRDSSTSTYCTKSSTWGCNAWAATSNLVGTPSVFTVHAPNGNPNDFTQTFSGTVIKDSSLNTYLNNDYYNELTEVSRNQIDSHIFNVGSPGSKSDTESIATNLAQEALYKWEGKVGLMSITDYMKATLSSTCKTLNSASTNSTNMSCSRDNWLFKSRVEWTISPSSSMYSNSSYLWNIQNTGGLLDNALAAVDKKNARPVVFLKQEIKLQGEGTTDNPYTIV